LRKRRKRKKRKRKKRRESKYLSGCGGGLSATAFATREYCFND